MAAGTRTSVAGDRVVREWREVLDRHAAVSCALEKALQSEHDIGLSEFETLDRLAEADRGKTRMSDLTGDIYLSQSALSRAVARLESDGLVVRDSCPDDRRAVWVRLTEQGRAVHERAQPTHRQVLQATWR